MYLREGESYTRQYDQVVKGYGMLRRGLQVLALMASLDVSEELESRYLRKRFKRTMEAKTLESTQGKDMKR